MFLVKKCSQININNLLTVFMACWIVEWERNPSYLFFTVSWATKNEIIIISNVRHICTAGYFLILSVVSRNKNANRWLKIYPSRFNDGMWSFSPFLGIQRSRHTGIRSIVFRSRIIRRPHVNMVICVQFVYRSASRRRARTLCVTTCQLPAPVAGCPCRQLW